MKSVVPPERLLVWNVKDGWEPLCTFFGKPVPNIPLPHENKTGDLEWLEKFFRESPFGQEAIEHLKANLGMALAKVILAAALGWYCAKSGHFKRCLRLFKLQM